MTTMIKIGTSGFSFPDWKGTVYPKKIKQSEMLAYYEQELGFNVCELNYTFYRLPDPYTMERMSRRVEKDQLGICVVDEPQLPRLLPYDPRATSDLGYFRFHGRNKLWYSADSHQRYDYFYSKKELMECLPGIKKVEKQTKKTFAFFNNCFMGQSAVNAAQMRELLGIKFSKRSPKLF